MVVVVYLIFQVYKDLKTLQGSLDLGANNSKTILVSDLVKVNDFEFRGSRSGSGRWSSSDALSKGGLLETLSKSLSGNDRASGCSLSRGRGGFLSLVLSSSLDNELGKVSQLRFLL